MSLAPLVALLGMVGFAAASFVFALAESALFSLGKWRAKHLADEHPGAGGQILELLNSPRDLLAAIVFGNTCANTALVAIALWMAYGAEDTDPTWTIVGTAALILFGCEVVPKTLAVRMPERWALQLAGPMTIFVRLIAPSLRFVQELTDAIVSRVMPKSVKPMTMTTDADYQELLDVAYQQGALAQSEKEIILEIISLDQQAVGDAMSSRSQMACIPYDIPVSEMVQAARDHKHTRLPMYKDTPEMIVGVLNTRNLLLDPDGDLEHAIEFPSFVPESMNLLTLFQSLQRQHRGMAIVVDEYGGMAGVITVQDILEEMIGKIRNEGEAHAFMIERTGRGQWRVNGEMLLEEFRAEYPDLPETEEVDTLGGLLVSLFEVVPNEGDSITYEGLKMTATEVTERRVRELEIERILR
ncbi:MAG: hemolysin family protein [Limisphaerales bacterium]